MPRAADTFVHGKWLCACALALLAAAAQAQFREVPQAPRLDRTEEPATAPPAVEPPPPQPEVPLSERLRAARPPNAARLAALPDDRDDKPDEVVVVGTGWRLPDLGSDWRERQAEENPAAVGTTILPLYDPEKAPTYNDTYLLNREVQRIGYIELFRFRFGDRRRSAPTDE
jgi:hypothetical protein